MAGPVTLVTGASGGIGGALAALLAQQGHRLVLSGLEQSGLDALANDLAAKGTGVATLAGDVRERDLAQACVDLAVERFGRLDHLVTGAGASRPVPLVEMDDDEWDRLVDINLSGLCGMCCACVLCFVVFFFCVTFKSHAVYCF